MKPQTIKKLLELNQDLYESQAIKWDRSRKKIWEKSIIDYTSSIITKSNILDLGCGNARLYPKLEDLSINYLGIDPSESLIDINKKKYPKARFEIGDGLKIKYKDRFDYIFCIAVLHHIPSEKLQLQFLKNIHRSLKKDGQLLLSVWNRWQPNYRKYMLDEKPYDDMKETDTIVPWKQSGNSRFVHCFTIEELKNLAEKAGFKNIDTFYADKEKKTTKEKGLNIYLICKK